jgi:hypothetical protein
MENSGNPQTAQYSEKVGTLLDGPPVFRNLDVVNVMEFG